MEEVQPIKLIIARIIQLQPEVLNLNNPANTCYCPDALSGTDTGQVCKRTGRLHNLVLICINLKCTQGCAKINDNDTYDASECAIWCRSGTLRVGAGYGIPKLNIVMSPPHFLFGQPDLPYEVRDKKGKYALKDL